MYTTQDRIEGYLQRPLSDYEAANIDEVIAGISEDIQKYTGRDWLPVDEDADEVAAEERFFEGTGGKEIFLPYDFTDLSLVKILNANGDPVLELDSPTHWQLFPLNLPIKQSIRLRYYHFPQSSYVNVSITAKWGSGVVPKKVVQACTALVGNFIRRSAVTSQFTSESIEGYSYKQATAKDISSEDDLLYAGLDGYKKYIL